MDQKDSSGSYSLSQQSDSLYSRLPLSQAHHNRQEYEVDEQRAVADKAGVPYRRLYYESGGSLQSKEKEVPSENK